jgi:hypothetical protein
MAELIPTYTISEFKKLKVSELKQLKSCEINSDGEYLFTFINPNTDYIKCSVEGFGQLSNSVGGKNIENITKG